MRRALLSPEAKVLFLAAAVSPADSALRQALNDGIDWDELCVLAEHEKATSILLRHLARIGPDSRNSGYQQLRQRAMISAVQMLRLEQLLHQAIGILAQAQIDTMLLKGAGLAYTAYSSFSDRPMGDLDLLVRPRDAERAWSLLQTHGWSATEVRSESDGLAGHHHLPRLFHEGGASRLEIHDALMPAEHPFRFSTDTLWTSVQHVTANRRVFAVPHPMHQIWHACVHFAWSHGMEWGSWRTFRDIATIIHANRIDWAEVLAFARDTRAATCCFWTLRLARRLAAARVPDMVLDSLRPPYPAFIVNRLEGHLLASLVPSHSRCPSVGLNRRLWEVAVAPGWSGHGASRPWHVSERWLAGFENVESEPELGGTVIDRLRKIRKGGEYLLRVSRLGLPVELAEPRIS
jgi:hypothetical protein